MGQARAPRLGASDQRPWKVASGKLFYLVSKLRGRRSFRFRGSFAFNETTSEYSEKPSRGLVRLTAAECLREEKTGRGASIS